MWAANALFNPCVHHRMLALSILPGMRFFAVWTLIPLLPLPLVGAQLRRDHTSLGATTN